MRLRLVFVALLSLAILVAGCDSTPGTWTVMATNGNLVRCRLLYGNFEGYSAGIEVTARSAFPVVEGEYVEIENTNHSAHGAPDYVVTKVSR